MDSDLRNDAESHSAADDPDPTVPASLLLFHILSKTRSQRRQRRAPTDSDLVIDGLAFLFVLAVGFFVCCWWYLSYIFS